jgi:hypothetical protein
MRERIWYGRGELCGGETVENNVVFETAGAGGRGGTGEDSVTPEGSPGAREGGGDGVAGKMTCGEFAFGVEAAEGGTAIPEDSERRPR